MVVVSKPRTAVRSIDADNMLTSTLPSLRIDPCPLDPSTPFSSVVTPLVIVPTAEVFVGCAVSVSSFTVLSSELIVPATPVMRLPTVGEVISVRTDAARYSRTSPVVALLAQAATQASLAARPATAPEVSETSVTSARVDATPGFTDPRS